MPFRATSYGDQVMQTRVSHLSYEPDDGPRYRWAPLAIITASLLLWAPILLAAAWVFG
jgi:hypothetical protein